MPVTDPIADYLTRIRNAAKAKHKTVDVPSSKLKVNISQLLKEKGYIKDFTVIETESYPVLRIQLKYNVDGRHAIRDLQRVSTPGRRTYEGKNIRKYLGGLGLQVLTTSRGLMTDKEARAAGVGGEVLFRIH
ncbi:MAG: 30S ribosomal protein S8 [[Candidatus Thermochlorobacteriaceae] bacterium GBChlB]|jgi:small subunit ribosomal protein S8|nr:MAG: 30S ribosomal protein S8 [[Candidatus Thermochlorobacteriaceae] bacterium GBChlB]